MNDDDVRIHVAAGEYVVLGWGEDQQKRLLRLLRAMRQFFDDAVETPLHPMAKYGDRWF